MSIQVLENPGTMWGRLGKGIGQALSEQIPKEVNRLRLSGGIKELGKEGLDLSNPVDALSRIYAVPGMTPELADQLFKMARAKSRYGQSSPGDVSQSSLEKSVSSPDSVVPLETRSKIPIPITGQPEAVDDEWFSPREIEEGKRRRFARPDDIEMLRREEEYFNKGYDPDHARQLAELDVERKLLSQQQRVQNVDALVNDKVGLVLQQRGLEDLNPKLAGEILQKLKDQAQHLVLDKGMSEDLASSKMVNLALKLAEDATKMRTATGFNKISDGMNKITTDLKSARERFKKYGLEKNFDNEAISRLDVKPDFYFEHIDPLKNKEIEKDLKKGFTFPEKTIKAVASHIKTSDNILSVMYHLRKSGISQDRFKNYLLSELAENPDFLTRKQQQDLSIPVARSSVFNDIAEFIYDVF